MTLYIVEDGLAEEFRSHQTWDDWVGTMSGMVVPADSACHLDGYEAEWHETLKEVEHPLSIAIVGEVRSPQGVGGDPVFGYTPARTVEQIATIFESRSVDYFRELFDVSKYGGIEYYPELRRFYVDCAAEKKATLIVFGA